LQPGEDLKSPDTVEDQPRAFTANPGFDRTHQVINADAKLRQHFTVGANNDLFFTRTLLSADVRCTRHLLRQCRHFPADPAQLVQVVAENAGNQLRLNA
jgi:hypothetical protein